MRKLILIISVIVMFLTPFRTKASSIFFPDSDTALLAELVFNSVSQLNELEQLLSSAEKYTKRMREYNEITQDHYYRLQQVLYIAESFRQLGQYTVKDLGDINALIREIKANILDTKELLVFYRLIDINKTREIKESKRRQRKNESEKNFANQMVKRAWNPKTLKGAARQTNQNTALTYKKIIETHSTQEAILQNSAQTNKILSKQQNKKIIKERDKKKYYNLENKSQRRPRFNRYGRGRYDLY